MGDSSSFLDAVKPVTLACLGRDLLAGVQCFGSVLALAVILVIKLSCVICLLLIGTNRSQQESVKNAGCGCISFLRYSSKLFL